MTDEQRRAFLAADRYSIAQMDATLVDPDEFYQRRARIRGESRTALA